MRPRFHGSTAFLLALVLVSAGPVAGQAPSPEREAERGLAGGWEGWALLTNEWSGSVCRYETGTDATSVRLELTGEAGRLSGSVAIDIAAATGSACPPLRKRYRIAEVAQGEGTVSFTDAGGNEWTLAVRQRGGVLQGVVGWREGGPEEPLAEDFVGPDGVRPVARLAGEVRLRRAGAAAEEAPQSAEGASAGASGRAPRKTTVGTHLAHAGIVIAANAVGLGLLYGANQLGKGGSVAGGATCSPRFCEYDGLNPCFCGDSPNVVDGAPCGESSTGVAQGGECDRSRACQSQLSCNAPQGQTTGICQDNNSGVCLW